MQAPVIGEVADGVFENLEFAGLDGQAVEHDGPVDDPEDRERTESTSVGGGAQGETHRHPVCGYGDYQSRGQADDGRLPGGGACDSDGEKQRQNGQSGDRGRP